MSYRSSRIALFLAVISAVLALVSLAYAMNGPEESFSVNLVRSEIAYVVECNGSDIFQAPPEVMADAPEICRDEWSDRRGKLRPIAPVVTVALFAISAAAGWRAWSSSRR
jgi:hypothetical protein